MFISCDYHGLSHKKEPRKDIYWSSTDHLPNLPETHHVLVEKSQCTSAIASFNSWKPSSLRGIGDFKIFKCLELNLNAKMWVLMISTYGCVWKCCVPLNPMVFMIIIPIKWLFHWEYTLFSDKPISQCRLRERLGGSLACRPSAGSASSSGPGRMGCCDLRRQKLPASEVCVSHSWSTAAFALRPTRANQWLSFRNLNYLGVSENVVYPQTQWLMIIIFYLMAISLGI